MIDERRLREFIRESNHIEGIDREPTEREIALVSLVLDEPQITVKLLENAVTVFESGAKLRDKVGMDVRVGKHVASPGGPSIRERLDRIVLFANVDSRTVVERWPHGTHIDYETLHPFTDGNGRSGRLLWLWMMVKQDGQMPPLGFLHTFYYQTLSAAK